ncbi:MAG: hypothetical protein ACM3OG_10550 [Actinomycetota bacterium]
MFDKDHFIQDCINGIAGGQREIREIVEKAVSKSARLMDCLGEPKHAGITPLHRSHDLTIINFVWAPYMNLMPHNHLMFSVIGIYFGREDNIFWRRKDNTIEAIGAKSLGISEIAILDRDIIHSVTNPIGKMTCAIHVYGGDFFEPDEPRSEWDHETLIERPWDIGKVKSLFQEAEARFNATNK